MKAWDSKGFWLKSKLAIDKANENDHGSAEFSFLSALALEYLARSALTKIHPTLNADPREDTNLLYACGFDVTAQPRSLPAHSVYLRLEKTVPGFGKTQRELCEFVALLRNQHVHTAELPYSNLKISKWLPRFYEVVKILNEFVGKTLKEFLGPAIAASAAKHIKTLGEGIKKTTKDKIAAHAKVFTSKNPTDQMKLKDVASIAAKLPPYNATSADCPACSGKGILSGELIKALAPVYSDEELLIDEIYLASDFSCLCCDLALKGLEEITCAELEPQFTKTRATSLHELYEPEHYQEYDNM